MLRLCLLALLAWPVTAIAREFESPGRVVAVTVFQGQALVTREVGLPDDGGLAEVVVTGLPERSLPESLYAEGGDGVEVRSVRTRVRPASESSRDDVKRLQELLLDIEADARELKSESSVLTQRSEYLDGLQGFAGQSATHELKHGVLDADAIRGLTEMIFQQRAEIAAARLEIDNTQIKLQARRKLAQRELETLTNGDNKTTRDAVLFLNKPAGPATVRLMYLVTGANWSPSYNVRAGESGDTITLEYNASVTQMSGESWDDIEMTLSTASPSLVAMAPKLDPLKVKLSKPKPRPAVLGKKMQLARQQRLLADNRGNAYFLGAPNDAFGDNDGSVVLQQSAIARDGTSGRRSFAARQGGFGAVYSANGAAFSEFDAQLNAITCEGQVLDFNTPGNASAAKSIEKDRDTEGMSVVYRLPNATSLPSRSDKQLVQIASAQLESEFYRVASPVLTDYVYREARVTNDSGQVLLAGPAATFLGDRFVGRGETPTVAVGEPFTIGLGIDETLRASRELVEKTDRIQGGNRVVRIGYRLTIENFGGDAAPVRVFDRLPTTDNKAIKVTLVGADPEALEDVEGRKKGLLRWDVDAPGTGDTDVTYTLEIEHDKNLEIVGGD